jgi:hypothetical protein
MTDVDKYFEEQMKNPEFKAEWEKLSFERQILKKLVEDRRSDNND